MRTLLSLAVALLLLACSRPDSEIESGPGEVLADTALVPATFVGSTEPFVSEAVYFVVTDRFVNGDPDNDHRDQGGDFPTFDIPLECEDGRSANLGYLGGDFRGLLNNAGYLRETGFTALWITPIVDNPDQAFSGGDQITCDSILTDRGKSGYHGYWGVNFWQVDEHLTSPGLEFADFTRKMREQGLSIMLDVVFNHGSPGWSMPEKQPGFGQVFAADGTLLADHGNLPPDQLDPENEPLHRFFNTEQDLAQLADFDVDKPEVFEYLAGAALHWIEQGAAAFRVDTVKHVPETFWPRLAEHLRSRHPGFFLLGEVYDFDVEVVAAYTRPERGGMSVFDFPLKSALMEVFENPDSDFALLEPALHLLDGPYHNPYELATFYDNHDMARLNADDAGFINAHNWLFTARGFPVIYYGSETGFMRGRSEHNGNRNYFGQQRVDQAREHPIWQALQQVALLRQSLPALQRGLQLNVRLDGNQAVFYRVLQYQGLQQTALVLLNKGAEAAEFRVNEYLEPGLWREALSGRELSVDGELQTQVAANDLQVWVFDGAIRRDDTLQHLTRLMSAVSG